MRENLQDKLAFGMDSLFGTWSAILIGIGFLISLRFWSIARNWCLQHWKFLCHAARMDGPPALPIIGNAHYFAGSIDGILAKITAMGKLYSSPFRFWLGTKLMVGITNPRDIKIVMGSSKAAYKSSEYRFLEDALGCGILTTSGPKHREHRNLIMPMVNGRALDVFVDSFDIQSRRCVECLESMIDKGEFDMIQFMEMCVADITFDSIIGGSATAQRNSHTEVMKSLHEFHELCAERIVKLWLHPDCIYYRTKHGKEYKKMKTTLKRFTHDIVAAKKKEYYDSKHSDPGSEPTKTSLLEKMIAYNEENKIMTDSELADEISTVLLAARDPCSTTSSFTFLMLSMHPEIQDKVRTEVQEVVGDENLTTKTISKLKYLDMVIKETIRLFPVATAFLREVQEDLNFDNCSAPKGCTIALLAFAVHRDPEFWDEPEKFNPDRFLPENSVGRHPYAYMPFSSGVRGCIGQQYAKMVIKSLVTRVVQKYRLHSSGSLKNLNLITDISVRSADGYKVSLTRL